MLEYYNETCTSKLIVILEYFNMFLIYGLLKPGFVYYLLESNFCIMIKFMNSYRGPNL